MVAVVVGHEHDVDGRHVHERDARRHQPPHRAADRRAPDRIGDDELAARAAAPTSRGRSTPRPARRSRARAPRPPRRARSGRTASSSAKSARRGSFAPSFQREDVARATRRRRRAVEEPIRARPFGPRAMDRLAKRSATRNVRCAHTSARASAPYAAIRNALGSPRAHSSARVAVLAVGHEQAVPAEHERARRAGRRSGRGTSPANTWIVAARGAQRDPQLHRHRRLAPPLAEPVVVLGVELEPQALAVHDGDRPPRQTTRRAPRARAPCRAPCARARARWSRTRSAAARRRARGPARSRGSPPRGGRCHR